MTDKIAPSLEGLQMRATISKGVRAVETTSLFNKGLTPETVAEIKTQQQTGDFRRVAGRPWWTSVFSADELKNAGL